MARTIFLPPDRLTWITLSLLTAATLTACGTTHPLPPYEPPLARANVQSVRTTAYTHTESDHLAYGNHNALGGTLHAAAVGSASRTSPDRLAVAPPAPIASRGDEIAAVDAGGFREPATRPAGTVPVRADSGSHDPNAVRFPDPPETSQAEIRRTESPPREEQLPVSAAGVGSAAADWSRWPAGTVFRIAATGQVYQVDDYGWALAGRNTIDLYQPTRAAMNAWGTRQVNIEILRWGDPAESLRTLRRHQAYRHIHRMVLELEGNSRAAAALE